MGDARPQTVREHLASALVAVVNARGVLKRKYPEDDPAASQTVTYYRTELKQIQRQIEQLLNGERQV